MTKKRNWTWKSLGVPEGVVKEHEAFFKDGGAFKEPPAELVERTIAVLARKRGGAKSTKRDKK